MASVVTALPGEGPVHLQRLRKSRCPGWFPVIVHVPAPTRATVLPLTVQTAGVALAARP
jgi:hypothetical protein